MTTTTTTVAATTVAHIVRVELVRAARTAGSSRGRREEGKRTNGRTDGRTNKRSSAGVCNGALLGKMPDKLRPPSSAFTPTFPWSLPLRQLFFEHGARPDAARKRITRANCQRGAQLPDGKPKINSPRGLPLGALISHACSTERSIAGAVGARASPCHLPAHREAGQGSVRACCERSAPI